MYRIDDVIATAAVLNDPLNQCRVPESTTTTPGYAEIL